MPAKVLFLTLKTFGFTGGIEKVCRILCRVFYDLSEEKSLRANVYSMYDRCNDRDSRYLDKSQFKGFSANRKFFVLQALYKGFNSDVIILSHIHLLNVGYLIKKLQPKKRVYLITHGIEIWKPLSEAKISVLNSLDKIICVSHFTASKIHTMHGIPESQLEVLNNCLDPFYYTAKNFDKPKFLLDRYNLNEENVILFSLSRLSSTEKYKGYDHNIELLPALLQKHPNLIYLLGGKWDDLEKLRLDELVKKHQLEKHIRIIGFVDEAEVTDHFLLSDIFIMPSKKEGFGIVFIEAIANGLQVIAGNKDGSVDALRNGRLGALVDPDNLKDIQEKIEYILDHPQNLDDKLILQHDCIDIFSYSRYKKAIELLISTGSSGKKFVNT